MESSAGTGGGAPVINVHNPTGACRLVRSPSRDSVTTQVTVGGIYSRNSNLTTPFVSLSVPLRP